MSNIFGKLQGAKTFEGEPVWERQSDPINIDLKTNPDITVEELKYGYALKEGNTYVLLKRGVSPSRTEYRVADYVAVRDWSGENGEGSITKGEVKSFAY